MSEWTHAMCDECWKKRWGGRREPVRFSDPKQEICDWCGVRTKSGIYVRADPKTVPLLQGEIP